MILLNLGCGTRTCSDPRVINMDWSIYLRLRQNPLLRRLAPWILQGARRERYLALPGNIRVWDVSRGLPFDSGSVDAVYHSHLLEHLDRDVAPRFLSEIRRVLRPGGIVRMVVPDLELAARSYLAQLERSLTDGEEAKAHDESVARLLEQSVRREAASSRQLSALRARVERLLLGDARGRGETHQWMYDRVNLEQLVRSVGLGDPRVESFDSSRIEDWNSFGLDRDEHGGPYKPDSLYLEARA